MSESAFNPREHLTNLNGSDYLEVRWRVMWFRHDHPDGRIDIELVDVSDKHARCKASVSYPYRADIDGPWEWALATGYGTAYRTDSKRGGDKFAERAETAALGRALAHLGYGTQFATELEEDADQPADAPVERKQTAPQTREAPRAANERTEDMATPKQITFAYKLARQVGVSDDEMQDAATRLYGTPVEYLSKRDASAFIERMQAGDISTGTRQNEPPSAPRGTTITKQDADEVRADAEAAGWTSADLNAWLTKHGLARMGAMTYAQRDELRRDIQAMSDAALEPVEVEA